MEEVDLITLKKQLPRGWSRMIGEKLSITRGSVCAALRNGNILHPAVQLAIELRDEHHTKKSKLLSKLNQS